MNEPRYKVEAGVLSFNYYVVDAESVLTGGEQVCDCVSEDDAKMIAASLNMTQHTSRLPLDANGERITLDTPLIHIIPEAAIMVLINCLTTEQSDGTWEAHVVVFSDSARHYTISGKLGERLSGVVVIPLSSHTLIERYR
jgi:hypothetical protein